MDGRQEIDRHTIYCIMPLNLLESNRDYSEKYNIYFDIIETDTNAV